MGKRPTDQEAHLGELQRGLWLLQQLQPSSPAYNLTSAFRLTGTLDVPRLERGLNRVVSRHRLLRSTFRTRRNSVLQIVQPHASVGVEQISCARGEALVMAIREARKPFDLTNGPLLRLLLIVEPSAAESLLILVLHHILADERSLGLLWKELAEAYDGRAPAATEHLQYDDYVYWLARHQPQQRVAELAYWRQRLDPPPDDLRLPFERAVDAAPTIRGRLLSRPLGDEVRRQIRRVAAATGTTPFIVLAFVFRLLLHRYTDGRDIAFATPVSRRSHPATAEMIGYFLNPVVISTQIDESCSVEQAIRGFSRHLREVMAHASVPFDVLVEELSPPREHDRQPIFQTLFVYQETPPPPAIADVHLEPITLDLGEAKLDLTLFASQGTNTLEIAVEYRADRFDEVWMQHLLSHYETLIGHLAGGLEGPTAALPMLRPEEDTKLRHAAQGPPLNVPQALLPQQIRDQCRRAASATALISGDEEWTYSELERSARCIADALARSSVLPGDHVGLFIDRSPLMIAGLLGSHWAGAAYVPLDPAYPSARNLAVLADAEVAAVLTRAALRDRLPTGSVPTIDLDGLPDEAPAPARLDLDGELPAYILYTSGSTGHPKGVIVCHDHLRASTAARPQVYGARSRRFLLLPSLAFDSSVAGIFWTLASGGALVIPSDEEARDPRQLARMIVEKQVTCLLCVPSLYAHLLAAGGDQLRGLETAIVAGESCPPQLVAEHFQRLPQTRLFNEYGPTEATVWATVHEIEPRDAARPVAIGRPIPGVRVDVLDALGRRVPAGIPGQGWISGATVARGYWRRQDLTDERFVRDGNGADLGTGPERRRYRTGDRLTWTNDGRLMFLGRVDEQIKLRGFRIEPGEIEAVLRELPEVTQAAVVAHAGAQLVAFVQTTGTVVDRTVIDRTMADLRRELAARLPEFMMPARIVELATLPRLPNGKVDRRQLSAMPLDPDAPAAAKAPVLDDREQALVSLWEGLLGRTGVTVSDNFFQLGGHSLLIVEMTAAVERDFAVALTPAEVFQHPTVRQLARRIAQRSDTATPVYSHLFPIQPGGRKAPFIFSVPHFFSTMIATRFRGERPVYGLRGVSLRQEGNYGRWRTMRDLGEELVEEICRRFPGERCIMAGYSFGATMAVEAVRLMEERGMAVERLYLIAPMAVDLYRLGPLRWRIDDLRQPVAELSFRQALGRFARANHPLTRRPYQRAWRLLAIQPWRRLLCRIGQLRALAGWSLTPRILHADVRLERFRLHAAYRPGIVRTPTVIFNAKEPETDAAATWRPYFAGPFTVHQTPDPHLDEAEIQAAKELILHHMDDLENA